jgi:uncharacterized repeat protein (TIGR02543 family)
MKAVALQSKSLAVALTVSLAAAGIFGLGTQANATSASAPTILFSGNTLSSSLPATETANRVGDTLALSTGSLARTAATTRSGYTFAGWSLAVGDAVTTTITTATTADTTRTIHAVWNTTITYNLNGVDSGSLTGGITSGTYRFGQNLTLPTVGTMVKSGFAFGGWMTSTVSTDRFTTYSAAADAVGSPTVYAAWIKTVTFNANTATTGTIPVSQVFVSGGTALKLPVLSETTLRKTGYDFMGWSTTATGSPVTNPGSYTPLTSQQTLYAVWKLQSSKATARVFFKPGKSTLRAGQKLVMRDMVDSLRGKNTITITLEATRARTNAASLGKKRNTAVVLYLKSLGVTATYVRSNKIGKATLSTSKKNNRVTLGANWTNPVS